MMQIRNVNRFEFPYITWMPEESKIKLTLYANYKPNNLHAWEFSD